MAKVQRVEREIIDQKILKRLHESACVAILAEAQDLDIFIRGLSCLSQRSPKEQGMLDDLLELKRQAFPR